MNPGQTGRHPAAALRLRRGRQMCLSSLNVQLWFPRSVQPWPGTTFGLLSARISCAGLHPTGMRPPAARSPARPAKPRPPRCSRPDASALPAARCDLPSAWPNESQPVDNQNRMAPHARQQVGSRQAHSGSGRASPHDFSMLGAPLPAEDLPAREAWPCARKSFIQRAFHVAGSWMAYAWCTFLYTTRRTHDIPVKGYY